MFFDNWQDLWRVALVGTLAYLGLVLVLRLSGKRTLSKWNAFDFVITIALGSTLATVLLSRQVSFVEGIAGLALLVLLQFFVTWLAVRAAWVRRLMKSEPQYLYRRGRFLQSAMTRERVTESELRAAVRSQGVGDMDDVEAIVLETDGSVSVVTTSKAGSQSALQDVRALER